MTTTTATTHNGNIRRGNGVVHLPYARNPHATAVYSTVPNCAPAGVSKDWTITQDSVTCARCLRTIGDAHDAANKYNDSLPVELPVPAAAPVDAAPAADDAEVFTWDPADDTADVDQVDDDAVRGSYRVEFSLINPRRTDVPLVITVDTDNGQAPAQVPDALHPNTFGNVLDDQERLLARLLAPAVARHMDHQLPAQTALAVEWQHRGRSNRPGSAAYAILHSGAWTGDPRDLIHPGTSRMLGVLTAYRMHSHSLPVCDCGHPAEGHQVPGGRQGNCLDLLRPANQTSARSLTGLCQCPGYFPLANGREVNHAVLLWQEARDSRGLITHGLARFVVAALVDPGQLDPAGADLARAFVAQGIVPLEAGDMLMHLFPNALGINQPTDSNLVTGLREYLEHHGPRLAVPGWHDMWL